MILVTGGTGLLGSYVVLQLARKKKTIKVLFRTLTSKKEEVYNLFRLYEPLQYQELYDSLQWVEGDILDVFSLEKVLEQVSQVYHVAGKVTFEEKEAKELYKVNVEGTKNLINLSIEKGIEKFCFISSIATLDQLLGQSVITEEAEWNPKVIHSAYACSKYGAEMEVWRGSQEGLRVIIVHPGVILGSGNWERSSGLLYDMAMGGKAFYTTGSTGYVDAEDVAEICIRLMEGTVFNQRYILVSENAPYKRVFQFLRKQFRKKPAVEISDFWLGKLSVLSRILPVSRKISKAAVVALTGTTEYSSEKITKELDYTFISLDESLTRHANNYLDYKKIKND